MRSIAILASLAICAFQGVVALNDGFSTNVELLFKSSPHRNVIITEHPHQVSLQYSFYGHICGGVILSEQWILTSARCVYNFDPSRLSILAGTVALDDEINSVRKFVQQVIIYPGYEESRLPQKDIALLQLSESLEFSESIQAVNLPAQDFEPLLPLECSFTGWGADEYLGDVPLDMRLLTFTTLAYQLCENAFSVLNITLPEETQCAVDLIQGLGPCTGEWGSPLICKNRNEMLLLGLGSGDPLSCGQQFGEYALPVLFSKIGFYSDWIQSNIKEQQPEINSIIATQTKLTDNFGLYQLDSHRVQ